MAPARHSHRSARAGSIAARGSRLALVTLLLLSLTPFASSSVHAAAPLPPARRLIVLLQGRSALAERVHLAANGAPSRDLGLEAMGAYTDALARQQDELLSELQRLHPRIAPEARYTSALNGLSLQLPPDRPDLERALRDHPSVAHVEAEQAFAPSLFDSVQALQANQLWGSLGGQDQAGAGARIAVIDSGIRTDHPALHSAGLAYPEGYPKGDARYTTPKVLAARAYFRAADPPIAGEDSPVPGAAGSAHGTQMAGIVAGRPVDALYRGLTQPVSGVAPGASLMNYRVFYPSDQHSGERAFTTEVLAAIEDAVDDGADIVLLAFTSLSPSQPEPTALGQAIQAAVGAGAIVVTSAGNQGPSIGSVSYLPAGVEQAITVGAVTKGQVAAYDLLDVLAPAPVPPALLGLPYARALFGATISGPVAPISTLDVADVDLGGSAYACGSLLAGSLQDAAVLIQRGECTFGAKAHNVQEAGAALAIIVNDSDDVTEMACEGPHCGPGDITIPVVMVGAADGARLRARLAQEPATTLALDPSARIVATEADLVPATSGRGPAYGQQLKPDVLAPGVAVLAPSVDAQGVPSYDLLSGASVAAAHVAGGAALLRRLHQNWSAEQIRAALISTAETQLHRQEAPDDLAGSLDRGGGAVRLAAANQATVLPSPAKVAVASLSPGESATVVVTLSDLRAGGSARTLNVRRSASLEAAWAAGVQVEPSGQVIVSPTSPGTLFVTLRAQAQASPGDYGGDLLLEGGGAQLHLPVWVRVKSLPGPKQVLLIDNDFSHFASFRDYAPFVTLALGALGVSYDVHNADELYRLPQTIPSVAELQAYQAVIWLTGDNTRPDGYFVVSTPLTTLDQRILADYMASGGRLLSFGQNLAEASDVNADEDPTWGRSDLYHAYLGGHWLQSNLYANQPQGFPPSASVAVAGLPSTFLAGVQLDLGRVGDGADNQESVDEVGAGGLWDRVDLDLIVPVLHALQGSPVADAYVGLAKYADPTLETPAPAITYRSLYYSFGLEGINTVAGRTTRAELLDRSLDWLMDTVSVFLPKEVEAAPNKLATISCQAISSHGQGAMTYRWFLSTEPGDLDDGIVVETSEPAVSHVYMERGDYGVTVEARDGLGHTAVASTMVRVLSGAGSAFTARPHSVKPGEEIVYQIVLSNTDTRALDFGFSLPLPSGAEYRSSEGGSYAGAVLSWSGMLLPSAVHTATLTTSARADLPYGTVIVATADITAGDDALQRSVRTLIAKRLYLPLTLRH